MDFLIIYMLGVMIAWAMLHHEDDQKLGHSFDFLFALVWPFLIYATIWCWIQDSKQSKSK